RLLCTHCVVYFFFFQAEDGIRDWSVTGVQTCALPIFLILRETDPISRAYTRRVTARRPETAIWRKPPNVVRFDRFCRLVVEINRSEERRVGKECRSRWRPDN